MTGSNEVIVNARLDAALDDYCRRVVPQPERELFKSRFIELFEEVGRDTDQADLCAALAIDELDAKRELAKAKVHTLTVSQGAVRRRLLEEALDLRAA
jgi:hypothetical protein